MTAKVIFFFPHCRIHSEVAGKVGPACSALLVLNAVLGLMHWSYFHWHVGLVICLNICVYLTSTDLGAYVLNNL